MLQNFIYHHVCCSYFQYNCREYSEPSQVLKKAEKQKDGSHIKLPSEAQAQKTHKLIKALSREVTSFIVFSLHTLQLCFQNT